MKMFEEWWMKYYKISLVIVLIVLVLMIIAGEAQDVDVWGWVLLVSLAMSPLGAAFGYALKWLWKLLRFFGKIILEFLKIQSASKKKEN